MNSVALIVSVGGSHAPVLKAIQSLSPDFVVFLCSEDDLVTGKKGSYTQISQSGLVIPTVRDEKPSLPNIPSQLELAENQYRIVKADADNLDRIYELTIAELVELGNKYSRLVCNYTGGTKSMSSALVLAALDTPGVELQLIDGPRANLSRVADNRGSTRLASVRKIRFMHQFNRSVGHWNDYNYALAATQLSLLEATDPDTLVTKEQAQICSEAFAAWDVFDHSSSLEILSEVQGSLGRDIGSFLAHLRLLLSRDEAKKNAAQILDLWLNARRCAVRGRYDDAMARFIAR